MLKATGPFALNRPQHWLSARAGTCPNTPPLPPLPPKTQSCCRDACTASSLAIAWLIHRPRPAARHVSISRRQARAVSPGERAHLLRIWPVAVNLKVGPRLEGDGAAVELRQHPGWARHRVGMMGDGGGGNKNKSSSHLGRDVPRARVRLNARAVAPRQKEALACTHLLCRLRYARER